MKQPIDRPWKDYPIGTKAHAPMGGWWIKTERGWRWCTGSTFPTPGGDAVSVTLPGESATFAGETNVETMAGSSYRPAYSFRVF